MTDLNILLRDESKINESDIMTTQDEFDYDPRDYIEKACKKYHRKKFSINGEEINVEERKTIKNLFAPSNDSKEDSGIVQNVDYLDGEEAHHEDDD